MRRQVVFSQTKFKGAVGALVLVAAACGSTSGSDGGATATSPASTAPSSTAVTVAPIQGVLPEGPSALDNRFNESFPPPLIDPSEIRSGGPPPDGIPPIDDPQFVSVTDADVYLNDPEPVLVVDIDGDVRAYPIQIMMWHEIVNDTVGGVPLSVTYCPLCNSAVTFERTIRGVETTFGTSGSLYIANLVMYDRATETLWNQIDGRAVVGLLTGEVLTQVPSATVSWGDFKASRPDAKVLDRERTGASRSYGTNPYTGLDDPNGQPFLFNGEVDVRAKAMQRIVAIEGSTQAVAWALDALSADAEANVTVGEIDGEPLTIFWKAGEASALDARDIASGRDVGTVGVFSPVVNGEALTFVAVGDTFVDDQTSSTWDVFGEAVDGSLVGSKLEPVTFIRTFWFSWSTFLPDTEFFEAS